MKNEIIKSFVDNFDSHSQTTDSGIEFWFARDLQHLLSYSDWRNFNQVITKAKISCEASNHKPSDHFVDANKMVNIRDILLKRGIKPENLPPEEDIKKLERRLKSMDKKIAKNPDKLE